MIDRLLLVGYGSIGKRHLRIARASLPDADIRILRHHLNDDPVELANGSFGTLEDALAFQPQAAIIANPAPFHVNTAMALADIGCHLLVEKPLSDCLTGVADLLDRVRARQCILQVGYNLRYVPSLIEYRSRIAAGAIGNVLSVRCEIGQYLPTWRPDSDYRDTVSARSDLGGGVLLELSHELDYLRWVFGEIASVNARLSRQSALQIDVEDTAHIIIGFAPQADGHTCTAVLSMDFIRHDTTRTCIAIGDKGSLRWNGLTGEIDQRPADSASWIGVYHHAHQRDDSYVAQWGHFLASVAARSTPLVCGEDGMAALAIVEAVRSSSRAHGERTAVTFDKIGAVPS